jgi:hypothetical protein
MVLAYAMSYAQSSSPIMGARTMGIGNSSAALHDPWSITSNIAGISEIEATTASISYNAYPSFKPFNRQSAIVVTPLNVGVLGVAAYKFGDEIYNEQILSAGYANQFGLASLGIKLNYVQYSAENFGSRGVFTLSMGGIAKITPKFFVGSYLTNVNQPKLDDETGETIPTRMYLGIAFRPADKIYLTAEVEKDLDLLSVFKGGCEYKFTKKFSARTGFNIHPDAAFIGLGFAPKRLQLDYGFQYQLQTGINHQLSLSLKIQKK